MLWTIRLLEGVLEDQTAATALEYGFIIAFVGAVLIAAAQTLAGAVDFMFSYVSSTVTSKVSPSP